MHKDDIRNHIKAYSDKLQEVLDLRTVVGPYPNNSHPIFTEMPAHSTIYDIAGNVVYPKQEYLKPTQNGPSITGPVAILTEDQQKQINQAALRYNTGKVDWSLLPTEPLEEILKVLEFGRKKYAAHNWCNGNGLDWVETANSLRRHLYAWLRGEDTDPESGLHHLAHVGCNVIFLLYFVRYKTKYNRDTRRIEK